MTESDSRTLLTPTQQCQCGYELMDGQDCPECGLPHDEAITRSEASPLWKLSILVLILLFFGAPAIQCGCGHVDRSGFIITIPALVLAWWPFLLVRSVHFVGRAVIMLAVIAATLVFAKNVADVLWFGHNPVF